MNNYLDNETLDNLLEGFQLIGHDWRYKYINETAARHGHSTKENLFGRTMMEAYPGFDQTDIFRVLEECMKKRVAERVENEFTYPDGSKAWFELQIEPVSNGLFILSIDISARKKAEEALKQLNESLEKLVQERTKELAEALEREQQFSNIKDTFVSMASHEFRTPLSAILSSAVLAEKYMQNAQTEKAEKHFLQIKRLVRDLTDILQDFLSLEQLEQGQMKTEQNHFDLPEFLTELIDGLEGIQKSGQKIYFSFEGKGLVSTDKKILRNVMLNMLSNAIKYSDKDIELHTEVKENQIVIRIKDYGIGIPEKQQNKLFDKFFRAENTSGIQGTGLGLHIVKHYMNLLKGDIAFESKENNGTIFTINLPVDLKEETEMNAN